MTLFIRLDADDPAGHPISEIIFRELFADTAFPAYFTPEMVEPLGYGIYQFSDAPEAGRYEKMVVGAPVRDDLGVYRQTYVIVPMTDDEKQEADASKATAVRADRNWKLTSCDWTQLSDAPVDSLAWANYRQALRDIPNQTGFPWEVLWPTPPE